MIFCYEYSKCFETKECGINGYPDNTVFLHSSNAFTSGCFPFESSYSTLIFAEKVLKSILLPVRVLTRSFPAFRESEEEVGIFFTLITVSFLFTAVCNFLVERQL